VLTGSFIPLQEPGVVLSTSRAVGEACSFLFPREGMPKQQIKVADDRPDLIKVKTEDLLSTGSTLLNLACSGDPMGGFMRGFFYYLVGDSDSGKTFFTMACMAEATINPAFSDYRFIYDGPEKGMMMDLKRLFNEEVAERLEPPAFGKDESGQMEPVNSKTIEQFYYHLDNAFEKKKPFIYVLDSMDGLTSESADKKFQLGKKAYFKKALGGDDGEKAEKVAGDYGTAKAKKNSENLRKYLTPLTETGSILIVISQTRDNIGGWGKTRGGGHALGFYATTQIWTSIAKRLKHDVNDKDRDIGSRILLEVKRSRMTGRRVEVEVDIYPSVGIDDLGSCVDFLVEERFWPKTKLTIEAKGLGISGTREKLIRLIEKNEKEDEVRKLCGECWRQIEAACAVSRKNRYQ
jgi:RecA/RadA recombinase